MNFIRLITSFLHEKFPENDKLSQSVVQRHKSWHHSLRSLESDQTSTTFQNLCKDEMQTLLSEIQIFSSKINSNSQVKLSNIKQDPIFKFVRNAFSKTVETHFKKTTVYSVIYPLGLFFEGKTYLELKKYRDIFDHFLKFAFLKEEIDDSMELQSGCLNSYKLYKTLDQVLDIVTSTRKKGLRKLISNVHDIYSLNINTSIVASEKALAVFYFKKFAIKHYVAETCNCLESIGEYKLLVKDHQKCIDGAIDYLLSMKKNTEVQEIFVKSMKGAFDSHKICKLFHKIHAECHFEKLESIKFQNTWNNLVKFHMLIISKLHYIYNNFLKPDAPLEINVDGKLKILMVKKINGGFDPDLFKPLENELVQDLNKNFIESMERPFRNSPEFAKLEKELGL